MSNAILERVEWFEKTLKDLRSKKGFICDVYHFGYCPQCDDITELFFYSAGDDWAPHLRGRTKCMKCGKVDMQFSNKADRIRCTGNEIPPKFKKKWDRMNSRAGQIKMHKEKMREYIERLEQDYQERIKTFEEANQRLEKFLKK